MNNGKVMGFFIFKVLFYNRFSPSFSYDILAIMKLNIIDIVLFKVHNVCDDITPVQFSHFSSRIKDVAVCERWWMSSSCASSKKKYVMIPQPV